MKKGIVMETNRRYTILMRSDGVFEKAMPVKDASIGDEVRYQALTERSGIVRFSEKTKGVPYRITAMACMLLLLLMPLYFVFYPEDTYAYVSIDINPSIELEIDNDLEVNSIHPLNEDARLLMKKAEDYEGKKLNLVIDYIMDESEKLGLLSNGKNMLVGVSYLSNKADISVLHSLDDYFVSNKQNWNVATFQVPEKARKLAKETNRSVNELVASGFLSSNKRAAKQVTGSTEVDDQERAIISSFFKSKESEITVTKPVDTTANDDAENNVAKDDDSKVTTKQKDNESANANPANEEKRDNAEGKSQNVNETATNKHPSELKGKNGVINSQGKNGKSNGKPHLNSDEHPGENVKKNHKPNGKAKGHHKDNHKKHKDRKDHPGRSGDDHPGKKNKHADNKHADNNGNRN